MKGRTVSSGVSGALGLCCGGWRGVETTIPRPRRRAAWGEEVRWSKIIFSLAVFFVGCRVAASGVLLDWFFAQLCSCGLGSSAVVNSDEDRIVFVCVTSQIRLHAGSSLLETVAHLAEATSAFMQSPPKGCCRATLGNLGEPQRNQASTANKAGGPVIVAQTSLQSYLKGSLGVLFCVELKRQPAPEPAPDLNKPLARMPSELINN